MITRSKENSLITVIIFSFDYKMDNDTHYVQKSAKGKCPAITAFISNNESESKNPIQVCTKKPRKGLDNHNDFRMKVAVQNIS